MLRQAGNVAEVVGEGMSRFEGRSKMVHRSPTMDTFVARSSKASLSEVVVKV